MTSLPVWTVSPSFMLWGEIMYFRVPSSNRIKDILEDLFGSYSIVSTLASPYLDLEKSNIRIHYIAGNHDFWDFGFINSKIEKFHKQDFEFELNNNTILLTHGDGLLKNDAGYRFMRKILRHKLFIWLFKKLPPNLGYKIGKKVSKTSEGYNHFNDYADEINKEILEYAKKQWNMGKDVVLVGHYHQKEIIKKDSKILIFLGDWLQHYNVTKFDGTKWGQFTWNEL